MKGTLIKVIAANTYLCTCGKQICIQYLSGTSGSCQHGANSHFFRLYPSLSTSLSFPLAFPSIGRGIHRPLTTPSISFPLVGCANRAPGLALFQCSMLSPHGGRQLPSVGQVRPSGHPTPAVRVFSPTAAFGPWDVHLRGLFSGGGTYLKNRGEGPYLPPKAHPVTLYPGRYTAKGTPYRSMYMHMCLRWCCHLWWFC